MNILKPGTVSASRNLFPLFKNIKGFNALRCTPYTLCVIDRQANRNSSRNGFGLDVTAISRDSLTSTGKTPVLESGSAVIPGQVATDCPNHVKPRGYWLSARRFFRFGGKLFHLWFSGIPEKSSQTRAVIGLQPVSVAVAPEFQTASAGAHGAAQPPRGAAAQRLALTCRMGGCHA